MAGEEPTDTERTVRLASIVAVDVAGFSRMSERDQGKAASNIEKLRARIEAVARKNEGRIFNTAGDGFMLEFASAGAALAAVNDLLDNRPKGEPSIRVGAHVGDVVVTVNNDLLGHGVNVAARLQSLSPPNTALVSGEFRSMARNSPSAAFKPRGRQPLENIDQRVATFAIISQKKQFQKLLVRSLIGTGIAAVAALAAVFAGPSLLRALDEQNFFVKAGDAAASAPQQPPLVEASSPAAAPAQPAAAPAAPAEPATVSIKPGDQFKDCESCPEMIALPGGVFQMGSPASERGRLANEGPQRAVTIKPFAMGVFEVTFAEWDACLAAGACNAYSPPDQAWGRHRRPVIAVSWDDAHAFVQELNRRTGKNLYRLPTEAEWEYAARAGTASPYAFGEALKAGQASFGSVKTDPVGSYGANAFGLFDMHGGVWEWTQDCYAATYKDAPIDGAAVVSPTCAQHVIRGGGYLDKADALRSAVRRASATQARARSVGLRVVRDLE